MTDEIPTARIFNSWSWECPTCGALNILSLVASSDPDKQIVEEDCEKCGATAKYILPE